MIYDDYVSYTDKYKCIYGDNTIVFIEIGSFFEIYGVNNEKEVSGANMIEMGNMLNIQVSRKNKSILENSRDNPMMAGFPSYCLKKFIDILIKQNYTVVIIEQVTPPPNPKREVTQIISPSTYIESLSSHTANQLLVIYIEGIEAWKTNKVSYGLGVSTVDLSTSRTTSTEIYVDRHSLNEELVRLCLFYNPKELVVCSSTELEVYIPNNIYFHNKINDLPKQYFDKVYQTGVLNKVFLSKGFLEPIEYVNMERSLLALVSFVYMLDFIYGHDEKLLRNVSKPILERHDHNLLLTNNALYQLDVIGKTNCLMDILNNCATAMGKRYFIRMLTNPLTDTERLNAMYDSVDMYIQNGLYKEVRHVLKQIMDFERIIKKSQIHPFQMVNVYTSLLEISKLNKLTDDRIHCVVDEIIKDIESALDVEKASKYNLTNIDENIFVKTYNTDIDELQNQLDEIVMCFESVYKEYVDYLKMEKSDKDGIMFVATSKKYTELQKKNKSFSSIKHRQNYVRVYTKDLETKNIEYIRLKNSIKSMVSELFTQFSTRLIQTYDELFVAAIQTIETVDYHSTNAYNAIRFGYYRPCIEGNECKIDCKELRHPIIEYVQKDIRYVSNDLCLNAKNRGIILYGINAAGKSSLMKSLGIALMMAQCGMFVPATTFKYFPYTRIHTRILNNDNLYKKQSTFMVEMSEIRNILANSDSRSLIIGDELCSGTESVSAISLVTAGVIHLSQNESSFIFATHLHELNNVEEVQELSNVSIKHLSVRYEQSSNTIVYDRILKDGAGDTLYGLEVCKSLDLEPSFMLTANRIRKKMLNMSDKIVHYDKSSFNHRVLRDECYICKRKAEDVHHIEPQSVADENHMIHYYHKNSAFNLVVLCKDCHHNAHNGSLTIEGYINTTNGVKLKYKKKGGDAK